MSISKYVLVLGYGEGEGVGTFSVNAGSLLEQLLKKLFQTCILGDFQATSLF